MVLHQQHHLTHWFLRNFLWQLMKLFPNCLPHQVGSLQNSEVHVLRAHSVKIPETKNNQVINKSTFPKGKKERKTCCHLAKLTWIANFLEFSASRFVLSLTFSISAYVRRTLSCIVSISLCFSFKSSSFSITSFTRSSIDRSLTASASESENAVRLIPLLLLLTDWKLVWWDSELKPDSLVSRETETFVGSESFALPFVSSDFTSVGAPSFSTALPCSFSPGSGDADEVNPKFWKREELRAEWWNRQTLLVIHWKKNSKGETELVKKRSNIKNPFKYLKWIEVKSKDLYFGRNIGGHLNR